MRFKLAMSTIVLKVIKQFAGRIIFSIDKWTIIYIVDIIFHTLDKDTPKNKDKKIFSETVPVIAVDASDAKDIKA